MRENINLIRLIEELAVNSWPSYIQQDLGEWKLRATMNVTKRANSVYTCGAFPESEEWLETVEAFYRSQSIVPCFYVSEISPAELDGILEFNGYRKIFECYTMIASCCDVITRSIESAKFTVRFESHATPEWICDFIRLQDYSPERYDGYVHIFSAIAPQKSFVSLYHEGVLVALGTVVAEKGWAGLSNIIVDAKFRGKGAGETLLRFLAKWALENDAEQLYLQVLKDNVPALSLYRKYSFTPLTEYHFRVRE